MFTFTSPVMALLMQVSTSPIISTISPLGELAVEFQVHVRKGFTPEKLGVTLDYSFRLQSLYRVAGARRMSHAMTGSDEWLMSPPRTRTTGSGENPLK